MIRPLLLVLALQAPTGDPKPDYWAAYKEFEQHQSALWPCESIAERSALCVKLRALEREFAPRFQRVAATSADAGDVGRARTWLVLHGSDEEARRATSEILAGPSLGRRLDDLCFTLATAARSSACEALARFASELQAPDQKLYAQLCLGKDKLLLAHLAELARAGKEPNERFGPLVDPEGRAWLATLEPAALERAALELLEALARNPSDAAKWGRKISTAAEAVLFERRNLAIGAVVPALEGEALDGQKLSLASYRGKVVLLVFWNIHCPMCMEALPHERELLARLKDKPFAILGVSGDEDRAAARALETRGELTWPSFWDQSVSGPIVTRWNIATWPRTFVLDREGRIRFKDVHGKELDQAVEALLAESTAPAAGK